MKTKLLGTAPTKTDLELLVNEFFSSTNYKINDDNKLENEKLSEEKLNNINKRIIIHAREHCLLVVACLEALELVVLLVIRQSARFNATFS